MANAATLQIRAVDDCDIEMVRTFNAPAHMVWDAHTKPDLVRRWLLGPDGWTMPVCEIDLRVGGRYRYVWRKVTKSNEVKEMAMGGEFREITPHTRIVNTERPDEPWYPGESLNTTRFDEVDGRTTVTLTMHLPTREARDGVIATGMASGVETSYARLDAMLAEGAS